MIPLGNMHTHILPTHILSDESHKRQPLVGNGNKSTHNTGIVGELTKDKRENVGNGVFCVVCAKSM
jgi:hypothetical protein